jgi:magnesium transporter
VYMQDVNDHILRMLDTLDLEREMASGALDAYMAVKSDQLNTTMKRLTTLSIIVGTVGCVFGAWGMNTGGVPFHAHAGGFWMIFGGTVALIAGGLLWGRKRGWL